MARIDVLLPVRNGVDFLGESLDSIIGQSVKDWRVLVLDHGSTDGSRELAEAYHARDPRIEVHSRPDAVGLAGLLNVGLDLADCEYVLRHDADDICLPERMAMTLDAFDTYRDCIAISGQADMIDGAGVHTGELRLPPGHARVGAVSLFRNPICHPAATLRFDGIQKLGVRYGVDFLKAVPAAQSMEVLTLAEDYFLFGQLAMLGKCANVPQELIRYRSHGGNVSMTKFHDQMAVSLEISRFLAHSLCAMHHLPRFDPAPFCNHGGVIFDVDGQRNFDAEFASMSTSLRQAFGPSSELDRELSYRRCLANRFLPTMLLRYAQFQSKATPETGEWNAVRSWMIRYFPGKARTLVSPELALSGNVAAVS
jgi:hypothetical protein